MRNPRLIILGALSFIAVLSVVKGITNLSKGKHVENQIKAESQTVSSSINQNSVKEKGANTKTAFQVWGRNPFNFEERGSEEKAPGIFLNGIVWDQKKPQAIINGSIVEAGDEIAGFTVIEIKQNAVVINNGAGNLEVKLGHKK